MGTYDVREETRRATKTNTESSIPFPSVTRAVLVSQTVITAEGSVMMKPDSRIIEEKQEHQANMRLLERLHKAASLDHNKCWC